MSACWGGAWEQGSIFESQLHAGEEPGNKAPSLSHKDVMHLKVSIEQDHLSNLSTLERGVFPSDPPIA